MKVSPLFGESLCFGSWIVKELNNLIEMTDAISGSQTNFNLVIAHQKRGEVGMT